MRNKWLRNRRNDITQGECPITFNYNYNYNYKAGSSAVFDIAFEREGKKSYYSTGYSYLVTHPGTSLNEQGLTLFSGRDVVISSWYSDSECIFVLDF